MESRALKLSLTVLASSDGVLGLEALKKEKDIVNQFRSNNNAHFGFDQKPQPKPKPSLSFTLESKTSQIGYVV